MLDRSESAVPKPASQPAGRAADADAAPVTRLEVWAGRLEQSQRRAAEVTALWRERTLAPIARDARVAATGRRWLARVPDIGPACEVVLADQLFHDLATVERSGLLEWIRGNQDPSGAWLDAAGDPDLSLTTLGWWARLQLGDDPLEATMVRAQRVVHALGGAQRANFQVRLWLAMGGQIPWAYLPAIPSELFLLPPPVPLSPARFSPWARGILTPYLLIARAPARLQLADATSLLLRRPDGSPVAPRLTRPGLAGDLLQAFDRTVKLSRKLPRGPMPGLASARAEQFIDSAQQDHGGWFSLRPALLSLVALRVMGANSADPRIRRGLDYLRRARGLARIETGIAAGGLALAQGLGSTPLTTTAGLMRGDPREADVAWLLRQELSEPGPWQTRADALAGGWPIEAGARHHLDLEATCGVLDALSGLPSSSSQVAPAWATTRRATDVILAMQEGAGGFSRFERGESDVFMRRFPWTDADLLAFGSSHDPAHVRLSGLALGHLGRTGFGLNDDRVGRCVTWLQNSLASSHERPSVATLAAVARGAAQACPTEHPLRTDVERRLRSRQREDGGFGDLVDTAQALEALLSLGPPCVQASRAARRLVESIETAGADLEHRGASVHGGFGLSPTCFDPTAGAREAAIALDAFVRRGGTLTESTVAGSSAGR